MDQTDLTGTTSTSTSKGTYYRFGSEPSFVAANFFIF
jgi:hypothetical protein